MAQHQIVALAESMVKKQPTRMPLMTMKEWDQLAWWLKRLNVAAPVIGGDSK